MKFGLIGKNVSYSKSPVVFDAIFKTDQCEGSFEIYNAESNELDSRLSQLVSDGVTGFSVTIPHKKSIIAALDEVDTVAHILEAVNSVVVDGGKLRGFNTDTYGFSLPLRQHSGRLKHGRAMLIGCGGSARAIAYSLYTDYEVREIVVIGRCKERLDAFAEVLKQSLTGMKIHTMLKNQYRRRSQNRYDIVVNCSPAGGWNRPDENPMPERFKWDSTSLYYDLNYNAGNKIIESAIESGITTIDGSQMLTGQAIQSYFIWTGRTVGFDPVYGLSFPEKA